MPYKSDKILIAGTKHDGRSKLNQEEKNAILILVQKGYSQRKLAAMFRVSRRLVQNIIKPQPRSHPPSRPAEYWAEVKRRYRKRKYELLKKGEIKQPKQKRTAKAKSCKLQGNKD